MKTTKIILKGYQAISDILGAFCTSGSYGTESLQIVPSEGWEGLSITATFHAPGGKATRVLVGSDGMVEVPPEATDSAGTGKIVFAGVEDGVQRISCNVLYRVSEHAPVDGGEPQPPTPGVVEQVLAQTAGDRAAAEQAAKKAQEATVNTPKLSDNQTWMIWDADAGAYKDTGVYSGGEAPQIGENGNWVIGGQDTGVSARGPQGETGPQGPSGPAGDNGKTPEYGVDYGTPEQIAGIAQSAAEILQPEVNQIKDDLDKKLDAPGNPAVGKILKVLNVNEDGTFVCEWADAGGGDTKIRLGDVVKAPDNDGFVNIPVNTGSYSEPFLIKLAPNGGLGFRVWSTYTNLFCVVEGNFTHPAQRRAGPGGGGYGVVTSNNFDIVVKVALCDGKGAAWTDTERIAALLRMGCTVDDNGFVKWTAQEVAE